ncbi:ABC transporter ATP-binding protein [Paenibacillus thermotolerans]|uniref:ABC transporter ATP-binding protein n=1 Tax=Paenibacillus thermotolerans TaxID=3027807 RepID=UPI002367D07B|nr:MULTISPECIES: ABC transporter ATP-binding protein [unclassified Paenibacillus]
MPILQLNDVVKRYDTTMAVDHMNLSIEEGEIFGLLGPNGAGKSTVIRLISGLLRPDSGEVLVDGLSVVKHPREVKRIIGVVPQDLAIYSELSASENVSFFARLYGLRGAKLKERTEEALEFVGLKDRRHDRPDSFSGGMKRRLNIACAIAHRPKLIMMDEPTVGIDPQSRNHILQSVLELNRLGSTIIYTSHYMEEVEAISTRVGIVDRGRFIARGTQEELQEQIRFEETLDIELSEPPTPGSVEELQRHARIRFVQPEDNRLKLYLTDSQLVLQDVLFILSKHGAVIRSVHRNEPTLEALFLALTGRKLRD